MAPATICHIALSAASRNRGRDKRYALTYEKPEPDVFTAGAGWITGSGSRTRTKTEHGTST
jgi:hypothetical protein